MNPSRQTDLVSEPRPAFTGATVRIIAVAIILFPIIAIFSPNALVVLLVMTSLALLFDERNRTGIYTSMPRIPVILIFALVAWSLVAVSWSPDPLKSLGTWGRVVGVTLCGLLLFASGRKLAPSERGALKEAFTVAGVLFVILFSVELITSGSLTRALVMLWNEIMPWESALPDEPVLLSRSSAAFAVFSWLCAWVIFNQYSMRWSVLFVLAVVINLLTQNMLASLVAFLSAAVIFAIVYAKPGWGCVVLFVALVVVNLGLAAVVSGVFQADREAAAPFQTMSSWRERLSILEFVYQRVAERPVFGWGFDASRAIGQDTPSGFGSNMAIPLHPHNLWAQVLLELGAVGFMLLIGFVVATLRLIAALHADRSMIAMVVAAITTYLLIGNISYGMWQNWWLAIAWLIAGFLGALAPSDVSPD